MVKVGSNTLTDRQGAPDRRYIAALVDQLAVLVRAGHQIVLVTSGAIAAGREVLGASRVNDELSQMQAAASVGQVALTEAYAAEFGRRQITIGQILLTRSDTEKPESLAHARNTFNELLALGVVPVVNENDTVAVDEICFGDNDTLAAMVAEMICADRLVILTDVEGLFDSDPNSDPQARFIARLHAIDDEMLESAHIGDSHSGIGSGGMRSKLAAARDMLDAGIVTVLCEGRRANVVIDAVGPDPVGTVIARAD